MKTQKTDTKETTVDIPYIKSSKSYKTKEELDHQGILSVIYETIHV